MPQANLNFQDLTDESRFFALFPLAFCIATCQYVYMKCFKCNKGTFEIVNSRKKEDRPEVWRRRQCNECGFVFTTYEKPLFDRAFTIQTGNRKKDNRPYRSAELLAALLAASSHLRDAQLIYELFLRLESELFVAAAKSNKLLSQEQVNSIVLQVLAAYDRGVAVTYAAQHKIEVTF